ncbi:uncharacterized protein [Physcomitrium patens]|uniref:Zinc-ribbon 15 domain-containing protein n=1 Tax=Physcomitrium patens TaxID=3218 RepID=A9T5Y0_PHYPA|nr:uncharacterized protein LOC112295832 [Physcomitrium patens]XP_024403583.1 uncharacterized protein LOC112295832 [Physcomitrium patens]XP_024403584.1 uncharacterized protein LOC112295832 [Physcomitrium patens]XP_024403585.1 uncharacterized protein LOC112295832 [Physcomitrium patens]PNR34512.1 hypothetical protein PHYPA_024329 [Physcomitrium patens]|eukprot:XP_024403582.1 uncharacterized protein LOC112295832 [Physcomitrella patens]
MVFFFLFGGLTQEVKNVIKSRAATCPICTSPADLVEYDNVLRLFFLPVWKWSGDNPAIKCTSCPFLMPSSKLNSIEIRRKLGSVQPDEWTPRAAQRQCWSCLAPIESVNFKFCPQCGAAL